MQSSQTKGIVQNTKLRVITYRLAIIASVSLLSACAGTPKPSLVTEHQSYTLSKARYLEARKRADLFEAIIAGDVAAHKGDYLTAMSYYLYGAELSKEPEVIAQAVDAARNAQDPLGLEQAAQIWLQISPENIEARKIYLESQLGLSKLPSAVETALFVLDQIPSPKDKFEFISAHILGNEPRLTLTTLARLKDQFDKRAEEIEDSRSNKTAKETNQNNLVAVITAQSKFIYDLSQGNKNAASALKQALGYINQALQIDSQFLPAMRLKTHVLYQLHQDKQVIAYLKQHVVAQPNSREISMMYGQLLYDLRDFNASAHHFTGWLNRHQDDLEARYYQAASYYALGQYQLSLDNFKKLLDKNHEPQTVAFYCGDSAAQTKDFKQAIKCFEKVSEGKFFVSAKIQLAKLYAENKQLEKGLTYLHSLLNSFSTEEKQAERKQDIVKLLNAEITLLDKYGSKQSAKEKLETALKSYPDELSLIIKKIRLNDLTQKPKQLFKVLTHAKTLIQASEKKQEFILVAARILRESKHYQLAINWLNDAVNDSPDDKELLYMRALYKEPLELYDDMIKEFKQLLKLYPDDLNIKNALGYTLADTGKELDYAQQLIDEAFAGLPNNAAVTDSKGWIAYRKGDIKEAEKFLLKAFEMQPSAEGAAHLGEVFWTTGKHEFAKRVFERGLKLDKENKVLLETLSRLKVKMTEKQKSEKTQ